MLRHDAKLRVRAPYTRATVPILRTPYICPYTHAALLPRTPQNRYSPPSLGPRRKPTALCSTSTRMAKLPPSSPGLRPAPDAVSLHSRSGHEAAFLDDDAPELHVDDLPPLYSDTPEAGASSSAPLLPGAAMPWRPEDAAAGAAISWRFEDANTGARYYVDGRLDADPKLLQSQIEGWATAPPRPHVQVKGTHQETVDRKGKKERTTATDFDVQVDLTPYLYSDATNRVSWRELRTVDNGDSTRRGTVFRCRAPGSAQGIEVGISDAKPTLREWCHLYCASHAGLKALSLRRRVVGLDEDKVRRQIESLVRGTRYRGRLSVTFPVRDELVEVYNDCRTNRWRLTTWIQWLCMLTLLFVFTWPYLFFRTKRFDVVVVDWPFSRPKQDGAGREYVSLSEDQWYNLWGRALAKAILAKKQATLDQQDLLEAEGAEPTFATGSASVDSALSFVRAGMNAMNEVNRMAGWGGDS